MILLDTNEIVPKHLLYLSAKTKGIGLAVGDYDSDGWPDLYLSTHYPPGQDLVTLRQLFNVLTDTQRKTLLRWVGEPYQSPSWQELWKQK
jgi:hypothetical protein